YSLQELSGRVRERLTEQVPDHVLALSFDPGMRRLLKAEIECGVKCRVEVCAPQELIDDPERRLGSLVVSPPGALAAIVEALPKRHPVIPIGYSSADSHLDMVRALTRSSIVAVASVSEHFLAVARGLLGPALEARHTLIDRLVSGEDASEIPGA